MRHVGTGTRRLYAWSSGELGGNLCPVDGTTSSQLRALLERRPAGLPLEIASDIVGYRGLSPSGA